MRGLNLDQLRTFLAVVESGSFSAAARKLHLSQPAVSVQIRELERRFAVKLIERFGKQAHATPPGRDLVEAAGHIFKACDGADAVDAALSRRLDRSRPHRHDDHGADVLAAAGSAQAEPGSSGHRPARAKSADTGKCRGDPAERDRSGHRHDAGGQGAADGHAALVGADGRNPPGGRARSARQGDARVRRCDSRCCWSM